MKSRSTKTGSTLSTNDDEMDLQLSADDNDIRETEELNSENTLGFSKDGSTNKQTKTQKRRQKRKKALSNASLEFSLEEKYKDIQVAPPKTASKSKKKRFKRFLDIQKIRTINKISAQP